jgi:hypothetical protein
MTGDIHLVPDEEGEEVWALATADGTRGVSAERVDEEGGWIVTVNMMSCIREDPLEGELRRGITTALRLVQGADTVEEEDREDWLVTGSPDPAALIRAAAWAVGSFAGQIEEAFAVAEVRIRREERRGRLRGMLRPGRR